MTTPSDLEQGMGGIRLGEIGRIETVPNASLVTSELPIERQAAGTGPQLAATAGESITKTAPQLPTDKGKRVDVQGDGEAGRLFNADEVRNVSIQDTESLPNPKANEESRINDTLAAPASGSSMPTKVEASKAPARPRSINDLPVRNEAPASSAPAFNVPREREASKAPIRSRSVYDLPISHEPEPQEALRSVSETILSNPSRRIARGVSSAENWLPYGHEDDRTEFAPQDRRHDQSTDSSVSTILETHSLSFCHCRCSSNELKSFGAMPPLARNCARTREAKSFRGLDEHIGHSKGIKGSLPRPPPPGEYVVLGIFDDSGILQEEVIVYVSGNGFSQQLVKERRRLFKLPILRDIKAFELYKCNTQAGTHVRVECTPEARDCLAALFRSVDKWERYYRLKDVLRKDYSSAGNYMLLFLVIALLLWGVLKINRFRLKIVGQPTAEEENDWRHWIQENLNESKNDPKESQYSLMCVVGWSRFNIVFVVVIPFCFAALASIVFGIVWSQDIRSHESDVPGAWAISTFIITLAAAISALVGIIGGVAY